MKRRRAVFLVEMLAVLVMLGVGGTLMTLALASLLRSQQRVVESGNRFARTNDFLGFLRRDMRLATTASLTENVASEPEQVLLIGEPPRQTSYRFFKRYVERTGWAVGEGERSWNPMAAEVSLMGSPGSAPGVSVTVYWRRSGSKDPEPDHRFDLFARCAGELSNVD